MKEVKFFLFVMIVTTFFCPTVHAKYEVPRLQLYHTLKKGEVGKVEIELKNLVDPNHPNIKEDAKHRLGRIEDFLNRAQKQHHLPLMA